MPFCENNMTGRFTFIISPLANVAHLFRNWPNGIDKQTKVRILIGVCGLLILAIWNCRNNIIFNKVEGVLVLLFIMLHTGSKCGLIFCRASEGTYEVWMDSVDGSHLDYLQLGGSEHVNRIKNA
jgi:hypothetical protein